MALTRYSERMFNPMRLTTDADGHAHPRRAGAGRGSAGKSWRITERACDATQVGVQLRTLRVTDLFILFKYIYLFFIIYSIDINIYIDLDILM